MSMDTSFARFSEPRSTSRGRGWHFRLAAWATPRALYLKSQIRNFESRDRGPLGTRFNESMTTARFVLQNQTKESPTSLVTCRAFKEEIQGHSALVRVGAEITIDFRTWSTFLTCSARWNRAPLISVAVLSRILPPLMPIGIRRTDSFAAAGRFARPCERWVMRSAVLRNSFRCCNSGTMPGPGRRLLHDIHGNRLRPAGRRERDNCSDTALPESCPNETARSAPWCSSNPAESYQLAGRRSDNWQ